MANYGFTVNMEGNAKKQLEEVQQELGKFGVKAKLETEKAESAFERMGEKVHGIFEGMKDLILPGLGIGALFEGYEFIEKSVEHTNALQKATADLHQTLISMHGALGISEEDLNKQAEAIDKVTTFSKPAIITAQAMLATFGNVKGEQFKSAMESVSDYAVKFMHNDMTEAAKSLGIALDDPIKGVARLHRQGVSFSAQQKEQIKNYMEQGKILKAQEIILKEIKKESGGQAVAFGETDAGKLERAKKAWDDVYEKVGNIVNKIKLALIPVLQEVVKLVEGFVDLLSSDTGWGQFLRYFILALGAIVAGLVAVKLATIAWNIAMQANPIVWIVDLVVLLGVATMALWDKWKGFRQFLGGFFGFVKQQISLLIDGLIGAATVMGDILAGKFSKAWDDVKKTSKQLAVELTVGMSDSIQKNAKAAGDSNFKFGDILKIATGQKSLGEAGAGLGKNGFGGMADAAYKTSELAGAHGGLGEAKVINIHIGTMQEIKGVVMDQLKSKGQDAVETMLRVINNISQSQSSVQ